MATFCGWFGDTEQAAKIIAEGFAKLAEWPPRVLRDIGGREKWQERLVALVTDRDRLHLIMDREIRALDLEAIPVAIMRLE